MTVARLEETRSEQRHHEIARSAPLMKDIADSWPKAQPDSHMSLRKGALVATQR